MIQNKKKNFRDFRVFDSATQNSKLRNIGKFSFNSNFDSLKSKKMRYGSRRKKQIALPL